MSTDLSKTVIKLAVALLKHQVENILGKDVIGIAGNALIDVGGEKTQGRIDSILTTNEGSERLINAALRADGYFRERCGDQDLRGAFTLTVGDQPSIQAALAELPTALDQKKALKIIQDNLVRDFPNLTNSQVDTGAKIYIECLNRALLPLQDFTLPIIGNAVLESKEDIAEIKAGVQELLIRVSSAQLLRSQYEVVQPDVFIASDVLPEPSRLPPGSRIPFHRNAVFTGREEDLKAIANDLLIGNKTFLVTQTAVTTGMGGIGKTQLAVEFCYRYGHYYYGVHWINAKQSVDSEIAACGLEMGLPNFPKETAEQVAQTLLAWQERSLRLIILDNAEEPALLREWLPKFNGLRVLVTSRRIEWSPDLGMTVHLLDTLLRAESISLLRKLSTRLKDVSDDELNKVVERLGDLPLALDLAGRYLNGRPTMTPAAYLKRLDESDIALQHTSLLNWVKDGNPTAHETNLTATFLLSWNELGENDIDVLAKTFFMASGYLAPNVPIPRIIYFSLAAPEDKLNEFLDSNQINFLDYSDKAEDAIIRLKNLGLLGDNLTLHPLLCEFARNQQLGSELINLVSKLIERISNKLIYTEMLDNFVILRPHIENFIFYAEKSKLQSVGILWNRLAKIIRRVAEYSKAKECHEKAFIFARSIYGLSDVKTAEIVNDLAVVLDELGDIKQSQQMYQLALDIYGRSIGENHVDAVTIINNLGVSFLDNGDLNRAEELISKAYDIVEKNSGTESQEIVPILQSMGRVLEEKKDYSKAEDVFRQSLEITKKNLGKNHPNYFEILASIGDVLMEQEKIQEAVSIIEETTEFYKLHFGDGHPKTLSAQNRLAEIYLRTNDLDKALALSKQILLLDQKIFVDNHPVVATDLSNVAAIYILKKDFNQASKYLFDAYTMRKDLFGEDHPEAKRLYQIIKSLGVTDS